MNATGTTKRNGWFRDYQEIPGVRTGKRKLDDRVDGFDVGDFDGRSVLDLGCNLGQMSLFAAWHGASRVLGVEYDKDAFLAAMDIRNHQDPSTVQYKLDDLDNPLFWHHIEPHDTVLLLSVIDTRELTNRFGILSRACMKCKDVLYFEGHGNQPRSKYFKYILDNTDFTQVEHIGRFEGRNLFRCSRNVLSTYGFQTKLSAACERYGKIAVLGNQMAGKSMLRGRMEAPGFTILDDCDDRELIGSCGKLILFDYRAAQYANDFDVVFNVLQPVEKFEIRRKDAHYLRSSEIAPSETLCCLYTVRTH
jgi:SAM-dependent methyltransferase